jgi:hypothetical protein
MQTSATRAIHGGEDVSSAPTSRQARQGHSNFSVDTANKTLTGTITYSGLSRPPRMAAFLSPPEKQGGNPGTLPIPLPANATSPIDVKMQLPPACHPRPSTGSKAANGFAPWNEPGAGDRRRRKSGAVIF